MRNGIILTSQEITDMIDDITRLFAHDVLTGSTVLCLTYKTLMALKSGYIMELKESIDKRADFVEDLCDQIRFTDLDAKPGSSLS